MLRSVHAFLPVAGDEEALRRAFLGDPGRWLPAARQIGPDQWSIAARAGQLTRAVTARVGAPWQADHTHWRSLSWDPLAEEADGATMQRLLPSLDGELGLHTAGSGVTLLVDARYRPPGGPLGAAVDSAGLHRVARTTLRRLLADVAARLTAEAVLLAPAEPPGVGEDALS